MSHSLPKNQPVTKTKINSATCISNVKTAINPFFDIVDDEDEEDFLNAPLDDIDFNELDIEDGKDFKYDDDEEDELFDEDDLDEDE
jgi:hypothetical protein